MKLWKLISLCLIIITISSCGETKVIFKNNRVYKYVNKDGKRENHQVVEYIVMEKFKSKLNDKTDFYLVESVDTLKIIATDTAFIDGDKKGLFSGLEGVYYTSENKKFLDNKKFNDKSFTYYYGKFALTAMAIPLKYRGSVGNDTINPPSFESGFNVNFAPSYRFNWSFYNPSQKFLGNNTTNYSITSGGLFGVGSTDLRKASNAPGLLSDRKSAVITYGGMIIFGLNTIGIGYSIGFDNVLGEGRKFWVYQNKVWHGITISVDLIK